MPIVSGAGSGLPTTGGTIAPTDKDAVALTLVPAHGATADFTETLALYDDAGHEVAGIDAAGDAYFFPRADHSSLFQVVCRGAGGNLPAFIVSPDALVQIDLAVGSSLRVRDHTGATLFETTEAGGQGFYGHAPAAQQSVTSGSVTPAQLANALQANGTLGGT